MGKVLVAGSFTKKGSYGPKNWRDNCLLPCCPVVQFYERVKNDLGKRCQTCSGCR
jgi:hypothetical protein